MPARPFEIRYPDGDFEIAYTRRPFPTVGQTIRRKNRVWEVTHREDRDADGGDAVFVYVEPAGAPGGDGRHSAVDPSGEPRRSDRSDGLQG